MRCNRPVPSDYRLAPAVTARVMGVVLVLIALMVFAATAAVAFLDLHTAVLLVPAVLALTGRAAWWAPGPLRSLHRRFGLTEGPIPPEPPAATPEADFAEPVPIG